jgi:formate hydrogenlyase subunit 3/multisubunit Na+/H+ antiporter MnhD subunit
VAEYRITARVDTGIAIFLALSVPWVLFRAHQINEETIARYGRNVDSGALLPPFAYFFLLPASLLFALAAVATFRQWRARKLFQWLAMLWLSIPFVSLLVAWVSRYFGV